MLVFIKFAPSLAKKYCCQVLCLWGLYQDFRAWIISNKVMKSYYNFSIL